MKYLPPVINSMTMLLIIVRGTLLLLLLSVKPLWAGGGGGGMEQQERLIVATDGTTSTTSTTTTTTVPAAASSQKPCIDETPSCLVWAKHGYCAVSRPFMLDHCPQSCKFCPRWKFTHIQETEESRRDQQANMVLQRILRRKHSFHGNNNNNHYDSHDSEEQAQMDAVSCQLMLDKCFELRSQTPKECKTHKRFAQQYCRAACDLCKPIQGGSNFTCPLEVPAPFSFRNCKSLDDQQRHASMKEPERALA